LAEKGTLTFKVWANVMQEHILLSQRVALTCLGAQQVQSTAQSPEHTGLFLPWHHYPSLLTLALSQSQGQGLFPMSSSTVSSKMELKCCPGERLGCVWFLTKKDLITFQSGCSVDLISPTVENLPYCVTFPCRAARGLPFLSKEQLSCHSYWESLSLGC
jgi:hypothetical protein